MALPRLEFSALPWNAKDLYFFNRNSLKVTFHEPDTGLSALDELSSGETDLAAPAEFPVVGKCSEW